MTLKQLLCPIKGTWYLCGGYEFGHRWRHLKGENRIFCRDCLLEKTFLTYKKSEPYYKEAKKLLIPQSK